MTELEALMEPNGENPNIVANGASSPEERTFLVDLTMEDTSDEAGDDETSENGSIASTRSSNEDDQDCDPEEWDARYTTGDADFREEDDELEKCWDPELSDEEEELVEDIVDEIGTPTINGLTFLRIVSEISQEINGDMSWDIDAIHALQEAAEDWLGIVLANALDIAVHAGRDFIGMSSLFDELLVSLY